MLRLMCFLGSLKKIPGPRQRLSVTSRGALPALRNLGLLRLTP